MFYLCPLWPKLAFDHHGLLIIPIHWLASSLCLLSTNKLVCAGRSGTIWLPSHHPGGCCTLVVVEEIPPFYAKRFEYPEKHYINVTNYYYCRYKNICHSFFPFFVTLKGFIIGNLVWLYCSDNLQNSKTSMTKNRDKIVNRDIKKKNVILYFFHIAHL